LRDGIKKAEIDGQNVFSLRLADNRRGCFVAFSVKTKFQIRISETKIAIQVKQIVGTRCDFSASGN
jgi:hypothetical protein